MYTLAQIEAGEGFFTDRHTVIYQRGEEDCYDTAERESAPRPGWHVAGGGRLSLQDRRPLINWCDRR